jgi:hypothetical protein
MNSINLYEKKIRSQNGEDGIIDVIFHRIGTTNKLFVEFGVEDGLECNCATLALFNNWTGLMIEGNRENYERLCTNFATYPKVKTLLHFITKENIVSIFKTMLVPLQFDLLSIDIDSNDYWVWQALYQYKPRLVVIEYNAHYPPPEKKVVQYNPYLSWNGTSYFGASLTSLYVLGNKLGYSLVGTDQMGVNAFFLRNDQLIRSGFPALTPEEAYHPLAYGPYPHFDGPYLEI